MKGLNPISLHSSENRITINISLLLGLSLLISLHLVCLYVSALAIIIAIIENILVYNFLFKGNYKTALIYMCVFYTTNYGNAVFFGTAHDLDTIYFIENLPLLHGGLMILSFVMLFLTLKLSVRKIKHTTSNILSKFSIYTICTGVLMGFLSIIVNGFQYRAIISDINQCVIPALMILFFLDVLEDTLFAKKYFSLVFHILISYIIIGWVTITLNIYADFVQVREKVLMLPLPSFYISSVILFIGMMRTGKDKLIIVVAFLSTIYFQLFYDSCMNGKSWIVFTTTIIVGLYYLAKNIKRSFILYSSFFVVLSVFAIKLAPKVSSVILDTENLKLLEFVSLFEAADSGDLDDMDQSSRFRFIEFINVTEQYIDEPSFALTGRGYGGSIHSNGYFSVRSESGFTDDQYDSNKFYRLHESMNVIYLKFGLIGLFFFILILCKLLKGFKNSPWSYIGFIWMLFFWGYQNSLLFIGLPAMVYALLCANHNQIKNTSIK